MFFDSQPVAKAAGALLNSTCFYFWFIVQGNCRDVTGHDVSGFPAGILESGLCSELAGAFDQLTESLRANSKRRVYNYEASGRVEYDEFYPRLSKERIDAIDRILAKHYGFTDEELDFVINYDIKYRMGLGGEDAEGE